MFKMLKVLFLMLLPLSCLGGGRDGASMYYTYMNYLFLYLGTISFFYCFVFPALYLFLRFVKYKHSVKFLEVSVFSLWVIAIAEIVWIVFRVPWDC